MSENKNLFNVILNLFQNLYRFRVKPGMTRKSEPGQSLLEVMVALGVTTLVLTSLVSAVVVSIRNARFAKNQSLATKYAQEGIEQARIYRDQNGWDTFWTNKVAPGTPETSSVGSIFSKEINYQDVSEPAGTQNRARIIVTVSWTEAGRTHQSQLTTYLTKWE